MKKKLVVLTGAGISAESGIKTFRDAGGLWEGHDIMEVASYEGWVSNKALVLDFYNQRRRQLHEVFPNSAHEILVELEQFFEVAIITQNVDNLHERAGSTSVLHLHGELFKVRSDRSVSPEVYHWEKDLNLGDTDSQGVQLRPHIVWFGEAVPAMEEAIQLTRTAAIFVVVGTSLQVYPAAGLLHYTSPNTPIYYLDAQPSLLEGLSNPLEIIPMKATAGMRLLQSKICKNY